MWGVVLVSLCFSTSVSCGGNDVLFLYLYVRGSCAGRLGIFVLRGWDVMVCMCMFAVFCVFRNFWCLFVFMWAEILFFSLLKLCMVSCLYSNDPSLESGM